MANHRRLRWPMIQVFAWRSPQYNFQWRRPMAESSPRPVFFENSQPILRVEDIKASLRFYVDKLGFTNASWGSDDFTSVNRDRAGIYLCRGAQGRGGAWIWIGVEDAEKL